MILLLEYDTKSGTTVSMRRFAESDRQKALAARLELELDLYRKGINHEATLLEAINEATIRRTHRRYFESLEDLIRNPLPTG